MLLDFHKQFKRKIESGLKIHTIRRDEFNQWQVGTCIQFTTAAKTAHHHEFKRAFCTAIEPIIIDAKKELIIIGGRILEPTEMMLFAEKDGFDNLSAFFKFFDFYYPITPFSGKLIHWTKNANYGYLDKLPWETTQALIF